MKVIAQEALQLAQKTKNPSAEATVKGYMAMAFGYENQYKKALKLEQESAQFFHSEGDTLRWLACLNNVSFDLSMLERQKECLLIL